VRIGAAEAKGGNARIGCILKPWMERHSAVSAPEKPGETMDK